MCHTHDSSTYQHPILHLVHQIRLQHTLREEHALVPVPLHELLHPHGLPRADVVPEEVEGVARPSPLATLEDTQRLLAQLEKIPGRGGRRGRGEGRRETGEGRREMGEER